MKEYLKEMKEKGEYDYYAWPGGYPLFYITKDCGILCPKCCNENKELLNDEYDPQWFVIDYEVNWEDGKLYCEHCNEKIESAYVEEVRAACEEHARRMRGIPLRCHKCTHIWTYRGRSHYRTTCPACHVTVYLDKCMITRGGSGE